MDATPAEEVVLAAKRGDAGAIDQLLRQRRPDVVRYAARLCISPADAEEATQETLLALSRYVGSLREVAALSTWLFRAVRTHCTRLARRSLKHVLTDDPEPLALEGPNPEEQLVDRRLRERITHILEALPEDLREVLVHRDILGESTADTATHLGLAIPAMKSRLHRARAEVKAELLRGFREDSGGNDGKKERTSIFEILRPR